MTDEKLCKWLKDNSSGVYRPSDEAAKRIIELRNALENLAEIAEQCDSWESFPQCALDEASDALAHRG